MSSIRLNTLFVSIGQGLRIAMAMLLLPVASRILGPASFGRYNLATTIMFFTMLADDLGLNMWVTREIAKHKERAQRYFAYAVGLKVVLIPLSLLFVALYLELGSYDRETVEAVWIFSLYALLTSFRDLAVALFRAFEEMEWESLAQSIEKVLTTALGIAVLLTGGGLKGLAWVFVASAAASTLYSLRPLFRRFVRPAMAFSFREFLPMLRGAVVFGISVFLTTIYSRIDMVMLSLMKGPDYWGYYAAAHKLIDLSNVVPTVLMIATFPAMARAATPFADHLNQVFTRGFKWLLLLAIPIVPGVLLLARPVVLGFYGAAYAPSIPALQILGCTAAVLFLNRGLRGDQPSGPAGDHPDRRTGCQRQPELAAHPALRPCRVEHRFAGDRIGGADGDPDPRLQADRAVDRARLHPRRRHRRRSDEPRPPSPAQPAAPPAGGDWRSPLLCHPLRP